MTPATTTELTLEWGPTRIDTTRDWTPKCIDTPALLEIFHSAETEIRSLGAPRPDERRERLIDELIAWATDPESFEPGAVDRIRQEAWGAAEA